MIICLYPIPLVIPNRIQKEKALETSIYIEDRFALTDHVSITAGIRLPSFFAFGPRSVFIYDPFFSKGESTIIDTVNYGSGRIYKAYTGPEYRVSLNLRPSGMSSFKLNYNRTRQYLHLLSNTASISPTDIYKLSDLT